MDPGAEGNVVQKWDRSDWVVLVRNCINSRCELQCVLQGTLKPEPKAYSFLVDPGVTFCPRGSGKCGSKMGPLNRPGHAV